MFPLIQEISPVSKWFTTISKSKNALTSAQDAIESKYRCSLNIRPEEKGQLKVAINALTEEEALAAKEGLYKLTMSDRDKYIRMSGLAMKFLLVKHEEVLKQLKQSCQEFHYPPFLRKRKASEIVDPVSIKVVGNAHDKQGADDTIKFLLGSFSECRFDVNFNSSLQLNQLEQLRQIYEEKNNMLIEIQHDPAGFKVSFVIYDKEGMQLEEMSGSQYGRSPHKIILISISEAVLFHKCNIFLCAFQRKTRWLLLLPQQRDLLFPSKKLRLLMEIEIARGRKDQIYNWV